MNIPANRGALNPDSKNIAVRTTPIKQRMENAW